MKAKTIEELQTRLANANSDLQWLERKWLALVPRWQDDGALTVIGDIAVAVLDARDAIAKLGSREAGRTELPLSGDAVAGPVK